MSSSNRHEGIVCDTCSKDNFKQRRYKCLVCYNFDLCGSCFDRHRETELHKTGHPMQCILTPADRALFYCGETDACYSARSFVCPLCCSAGFGEVELLDHVTGEHLYDRSAGKGEVLCPLCVCSLLRPNNQPVVHLARHFLVDHRRRRHQQQQVTPGNQSRTAGRDAWQHEIDQTMFDPQPHHQRSAAGQQPTVLVSRAVADQSCASSNNSQWRHLRRSRCYFGLSAANGNVAASGQQEGGSGELAAGQRRMRGPELGGGKSRRQLTLRQRNIANLLTALNGQDEDVIDPLANLLSEMTLASLRLSTIAGPEETNPAQLNNNEAEEEDIIDLELVDVDNAPPEQEEDVTEPASGLCSQQQEMERILIPDGVLPGLQGLTARSVRRLTATNDSCSSHELAAHPECDLVQARWNFIEELLLSTLSDLPPAVLLHTDH